jgi:adenosine deaminase
VDTDAIRRLPKVLLHDHLDGGLRPSTIVDLASDTGYRGLPETDPDALERWMRAGADRKDLELYLETFAHTVGVMQTDDGLARVARECAEDLAADGVVYAEVRFAPELHRANGLELDDVVEAVVGGFGEVAGRGGIRIGTIVTAMRTADDARPIAALAARWARRGVVGFDIAGPEAGFAPARHLAAFQLARAGGLGITIHAGEGYGPASIREAVVACGADRIGHGVHVADDIEGTDGVVELGPTARLVLERQVPLELCPSSNVHSGAAASIAAHPIGALADLGFAVTVNTDNRLMSGVTLTAELSALVDAFGWDDGDLRAVSERAASAAFLDPDARDRLVARIRSWSTIPDPRTRSAT